MKNFEKLVALSVILSLLIIVPSMAQSSSEEPMKEIEKIVGKWELQKVYAGGREISRNPNAGAAGWIEFMSDGKYEQNAEESDHGSYRLNENHSVLYLESDDKTSTTSATSVPATSEYTITIMDGILTMQTKGQENSGKGNVKYVYAKAAGGENK